MFIMAFFSFFKSKKIFSSTTTIFFLVLGTSACTSNPVAPASPRPSSSVIPNPSSSPNPTQQATSDEKEPVNDVATPFSKPCDQIITDQQIYDYNPNITLYADATLEPDALHSKIAQWSGKNCAWIHQSNQSMIRISIAKPPAAELETLKNTAMSSGSLVPTYGVPPTVEGYFSPETVQIFSHSHWIVATSNMFLEPGDASALMNIVLENLFPQ